MKQLPKIAMLILLISCSNGKQKQINTPDEYKSVQQISPGQYSMDSTQICSDLNQKLKTYEDPFYRYKHPYVDTTKTEILIDTILYDNSRTKMCALIIVKYMDMNYYRPEINNKIPPPNIQIKFDARGFLAKRHDSKLKYTQVGRNFVNYKKQSDLKSMLNEYFFGRMSPKEDKDFSYNIDDKRIWNEPIWDTF